MNDHTIEEVFGMYLRDRALYYDAGDGPSRHLSNIAGVLGHSSTRTTLIYIDDEVIDRAEEIERLDSIVKSAS